MLKSLELFGFKSFADRTRFDFAAGVTCVVGPNGSGKSNVVDALKWILGDQSAKSLRGKEMTDVIFNGSKSRKANGFAEATLTFDNSAGLLPVEAAEVQIGRRLWRNGDSEYLLNRSAVRLKDIRDLFLGTGAGSAAYSIIEQGRVDQILQANPVSRRAVFEEAAGISRFKARRTDAQRKLERVDQNLIRLTDIVDEVEARLNATRSQAAKAAKFREISEELKSWWQGLAADDCREFDRELHGLAERLEELQRRDAELLTEQREHDARVAAIDVDMAALDDLIRDVQKRNTTSREAMAGATATIESQRQRLHETETEIVRLQRQQLVLQHRMADGTRAIQREQAALNELEVAAESRLAALEGRAEELTQLTQRVSELQSQLEEERARRLQLTREIAGLDQSLVSWQDRESLLGQTLEDLDGRLESMREQRREVEEEVHSRQLVVQQATRTLATAQQVLKTIQTKREELLVSQRATQAALADARERRSATVARRLLLEDLESRQEGIGLGAREILARARQSREKPWCTVLGLAADLLDVDLENAALLEVALGSRGQLLVVNDFVAWQEYLFKNPNALSGRIGFLCLSGETAEVASADRAFDSLRLPFLHGPDLAEQPGVLQRADGLAVAQQQAGPLAETLLGDTWVVETLDVAISLAAGPGRGCRFVTLQGEVLEADGSITVGPVRTEAAVLSRKSELKRLKQQIHAIDHEIESRESSLAVLYEGLRNLEVDLEQAASAVDETQDLLTEARAALNSQDRIREQVENALADLTQRQQSLTVDLTAARQEIERCEQGGMAAREKLAASEELSQQLTEELAVLNGRCAEMEEERNAHQVDLAKHAERTAALRTQLERLNEDLEQRQLQAAEGARRVDAVRQKRDQIALQILNARAELDERRHQAEQIDLEVVELNSRRAEIRDRRGVLSRALSELQSNRRSVSTTIHELELRRREVLQNVASLRERLEEEYQVDLHETVATGVSAYRMYLDEIHAASESEDAEHEAPQRLPENPPPFSEVRGELDGRVQRLKKKLKLLGSVNPDSLAELDSLESRFSQLSSQLSDLVEAKSTLEDIIRRINGESRRMFLETYETVRANFQELFRTVFGGGEGDIILEDMNDVLECGIEIQARPPGKELRSLSLLSGGEKTMTAIALIMAIFQAKPSPFCILDEVDAALDEANVERFTNVIRKFQNSTQFIMITHHKRSMTVGDVLYGVTMEESGVSKRMAVRFEDVGEDGRFKSAA